MPHISLVVPHQLGQEEARRRLQEKSNKVRAEFSSQVSNARDHWDGNVLAFAFTAMGMPIKGTLTVEPSEVQVDADIPLVAMMFKSTIERRAREELSQVLSSPGQPQ